MAILLSSQGSLRRKGWCNCFKVFFIISQLFLLFLLFEVVFSDNSATTVSAYPTFSEARELFFNSVGLFSVMRPVDPNLASSSYLSTSKLSTRDKNFLRYFIDDYISFHKQNRQNSTRRLIFTPQRTGIGDRMGCLMFAYWAAVLSKRVFLVDWHYPFPLNEFLTEANGLRIFLEEGEIDDEAKVGKLAWLSFNKSSLDTYEAVLSSDTDLVIMATNKLPGRFSKDGLSKLLPPSITPADANNMRINPNFHRAILHHVFRLADRMRRDQATLNHQMGLSADSTEERRRKFTGMGWTKKLFLRPRTPYIAVHARIGTGVAENKSHRFKHISENMKTAARCLAMRAIRLAFMGGNPALPVYLATDTPQFRDIFKKVVHMYANGKIDVITGNWSVQHSNKLPANLNKKYRAANWEVMWGSYMDLVMLGHGQHILGLYSSFPRLAAAMGNAETLTEFRNHICFAPQRDSQQPTQHG